MGIALPAHSEAIGLSGRCADPVRLPRCNQALYVLDRVASKILVDLSDQPGAHRGTISTAEDTQRMRRRGNDKSLGARYPGIEPFGDRGQKPVLGLPVRVCPDNSIVPSSNGCADRGPRPGTHVVRRWRAALAMVDHTKVRVGCAAFIPKQQHARAIRDEDQ